MMGTDRALARALRRGLSLSAMGLAATMLLLPPRPSLAEPYLAIESGLKCNACHTNPTGGGKRSLFGMTYARTRIAERVLFEKDDTRGWNSRIGEYVGIGGDYRGGYRNIDTVGPADNSDWQTFRGQAYLEVRPVPGIVTVYADQQLAPGGSLNREAFVLVTPRNGRYTVKAGQFFLPFGFRLQDDTTFVRQRSGVNFDAPDEGVEFGVELPNWSAQAAFTDGTAGAGRIAGKDQTSLSFQYIQPRWRAGFSRSLSKDPLGDREMHAIFAGWKTGPISWLAELDLIEDEIPGTGDRETYATLVEGNWRFLKAHNLKASYEFLDPDDAAGEDEQERYSVVWEYSPVQLLQTRAGYRSYNGVPQLPRTNRHEMFVEFHVYF